MTDEGLSEGESYHVTYGFTGYQVDVYRLLYDKDGNLLLRTFENESIYSKRARSSQLRLNIDFFEISPYHCGEDFFFLHLDKFWW